MMTAQTNAIYTYFESDHDRLDALLANFRLQKNTDYAAAKPFFREFKFGLQRHIIWEEEILFPLFERKTGMAEGGPTEVMRREHRMIGKCLEELHEKVRKQNPSSDEEEKQLIEILSMHNRKEELLLYPAIDRLLNDGDVERVFEAMKAVPEERYAMCCQHTH